MCLCAPQRRVRVSESEKTSLSNYIEHRALVMQNFFCDCWKNDVWCDVLRGAGEDISVRFLYYTFVHTFSKSKLMMENCFFERKKIVFLFSLCRPSQTAIEWFFDIKYLYFQMEMHCSSWNKHEKKRIVVIWISRFSKYYWNGALVFVGER